MKRMEDVVVSGSLLRPYAWALSFFYSLFTLLSVFIIWFNQVHSEWSETTTVLIIVFGYGLSTYIALLTQMILAYDLTLKDDGVVLRYRKPLTPWSPSFHEQKTFTWEELREPSVKAGQVTVKSNDPYHWIVLSYEQARKLLTDSRCPLANNVPEKVRVALGLPVHP